MISSCKSTWSDFRIATPALFSLHLPGVSLSVVLIFHRSEGLCLQIVLDVLDNLELSLYLLM